MGLFSLLSVVARTLYCFISPPANLGLMMVLEEHAFSGNINEGLSVDA